MNHLVIKSEEETKDLDNHSLFFVDTKLDSRLFEQLLDIYMAKEIDVYKRLNCRYAEQTVESERQRIVLGDTTNLEHYEKVDFLKNQYNHYLGLKKNQTDACEEQLNNFRESKLKRYNLLLEKYKHLVIEVYIDANEQLEFDLNLFHHTVDASYLAFTNNPNKYFTYTEVIEGEEELISKSNYNSTNTYFLLPYSGQYKPAKKVVYINTMDYKASYEAIRNEDYIVILNDELEANQYVINQCKENLIVTQLDIELEQAKYVGQDMNALLIIKLVEIFGKVEIYEFDGVDIIKKQKLQKNEYQYQKQILSYKNDLYYFNRR